MADVDAIVVGAGVVGLAVARAIARTGRSLLVLDGEDAFGTWTSSRNSEVIHAGIYYPAGSLKGRLCVAGRDKLYDYCAERGIPHRRCGKLIFAATQDQLGKLEEIDHLAKANGVDDLVRLGTGQVRDYEPELNCAGAFYSPSTGIIDVHAYMLALLGDAEAHGATFVANSLVERVARTSNGWEIYLPEGTAPVVTTGILVNAGGLTAQRLALATEGLDPGVVPPLHLARGVYFSYSGKIPFSHLIYPVPEPGGLGLHLTLDLGGQARFGPDVEWIDEVNYTIDEARKPSFVAAARRIWNALDPEKLIPGYAGIRPKLSGAGQPVADFVIAGPSDHGCPGLVNLFGIESPGLTASLAIADLVLAKLDP